MKSLYVILLFILGHAQACQKWSYVQSPTFKKARQERVAHMVDGCDTIIEIGGAGAPISGFLSKDKKVIVITDLPIEGTDKFFLRFLLEK